MTTIDYLKAQKAKAIAEMEGLRELVKAIDERIHKLEDKRKGEWMTITELAESWRGDTIG